MPVTRRVQGFTLIELMVSVAIVSIVAMVAYPNYVQHLQHGRRAQAQSAMMLATQHLHRFHAARGHYGGATLPPAYAQSEGYTLALRVGEDLQSFSVEATPDTPDERCGVLRLQDTGAKSQSGSGSVAACW